MRKRPTPTDTIEQIDIAAHAVVGMTDRTRVRETLGDIAAGVYGHTHVMEYVLSVAGRTFSRAKQESHWIDDATFARVEFRNVPDVWKFLTGAADGQ